MRPAYYNEIDSYAADWLENLIKAGLIAPGDVDRRSIVDLRPSELAGFTQVHLFAGIGVWSLALRRAGWPDDRPIWTGSCPCQPFSSAGKGGGFDDERHLWPYMHHLVRVCRPDIVLGEQVASKDGLAWLDLVQSDLEGEGYAVGAVDTCAAGFGAPHIRQRLYWVAHGHHDGQSRLSLSGLRGAAVHDADRCGAHLGMAYAESLGSGSGLRDGGSPEHGRYLAPDGGELVGMVDSASARGHGRERRSVQEAPGGHQGETPRQGDGDAVTHPIAACRMADAERERIRPCGSGSTAGAPAEMQGDYPQREWIRSDAGASDDGVGSRPRPTNGLWRDADWLFCRDERWRPVEPGAQPLAHGAAARVGRLRAYGNAITLGQAQSFIEALMDSIP